MKLHVSLICILSALPILCLADPSEVAERQIDVPKCATPAARVVFTEFKCKSADCSSGASAQDPRQYRWWQHTGTVSQPSYTGVGTGMTEMLATALTQTGCFDVQERAELDEIHRELALMGKRVEAEAADYMITGSITSLGFEQSSTGLGGLSFLKGPLSLLAGAVDYKQSKVHMNIDIRVVDVRRARIVASKTFQANNQRSGFGISAMGWGGGTGLGGNHASISGSPLEEVARDLLVKSTAFLTQTIAAKHITEHVAVTAGEVAAK
jgi:curli biogenesis system outer membrane secretion channel CsgG